MSAYFFDCNPRLGSTSWKGQILCSGYQTYIGGKEVELVDQVCASQLPVIIGTSKDSDVQDDDMFGSPSVAPVQTRVLPQARVTSSGNSLGAPQLAGSTSIKKYVAPVSFYGAPANPKPTGPLCVESASFHCSFLIWLNLYRHDPNAEGAVVMKAPTKEHAKKFNKKFNQYFIL